DRIRARRRQQDPDRPERERREWRPGRRPLSAARSAPPHRTDPHRRAAQRQRGDPVLRRLPIIVGVVVVLVILGLSSIFVVDERKQALVLQFGQVKQIRTDPGLYFKLPLIQDVVYFEGRILPLDTDPLEVTPLD